MCHSRTDKIKFKVTAGTFIWVLLFAATTALAAGDVAEVTIVAQAGAETGENAAVGAPVQTIVFQPDITIQQALRVLGQRYQKNIVPSPNVDGVLSFTRLYNVTFDEAIEAILSPNLKYETVGQLIKVYTKDEYKKIKADTDRMVHEVFTLHYITAKDAVDLIRPVLSKAAQVQYSTPAESEISSAGGGSTSGAAGGLSSGGGGDSLAQNDTIVVFDFPENIEKARQVIDSLDIRPRQVLIEATILAARLTEGMELGVDMSFMAGVRLEGTDASGAVQDDVLGGALEYSQSAQNPLEQVDDLAGAPIETAGFASVGGTGLRVGISAGDFRALITALESVTDVTVLANPKILAVNKQAGSVHIGRTLGYRSSTTISTGGIATEGQVEFLDTGTRLVFRPYIGDDGYIRMDIYPKDSTAELNIEGVPDETTTELKTNIIVRDGETIVLGGLFRDVVTSMRDQIPLLGDIPIIGALFRGTTDLTQREEVIILLTPHIIDAAGQTDGEQRAADIGRKRYGARQTLQWISRSRLAEDHYVKAVELYTRGEAGEAMAELKEALRLRPTYFEALRLQERIIGETSPDEVAQIERIMLGVIDEEEAALWKRR